MRRLLHRLLNLQAGDLRHGGLLFLYLFGIIFSYVVGKAVRDALFLDRFSAITLPYADIAIAILVGFVVAAYVRVGRIVGLRNLLAGSLLLFASNSVAFWWAVHNLHTGWVYPVLYVWVGVFGVLAPAQVWTLSNWVLTTREAKRLYGLVGSGAIAAWIVAGWFTRWFVGRFGTEALLLVVTVILTTCAGLVGAIWRDHESRRDGDGLAGTPNIGATGALRSLQLVASSRYLRTIAAVICISSFVTTVAGWQFKAFAKQALQEKDRLAAFFGSFNLYAGLLCLVVQLLFTARILRRFGLGPALFAVPVALLAGTAGLLVWPVLAMAVVLKGSDQVLRYSLDRSSVELLYLPVAAEIKVQVKSFIDTVVWRLGDGLAGVSLLLAAIPLGLEESPAGAGWVNLLFIGAWLAAATAARRRYVETLRDTIRRHRLDAERASAPVLDRTSTEVLQEKLGSDDVEEILYALDLFQVEGSRAPHPAVRGLLSHPSPEVRRRAIGILDAAADTAAAGRMEELLRDEDLGIRTDALLFLAHHSRVDPLARIQELGDFPGYSIRSGIVAFLARPGEAQNLETARWMLAAMAREHGTEGVQTRREAARLLAELPPHFPDSLHLLLADQDPEVVRLAVRAAGRQLDRASLPRLLALLADPHLAGEVTTALAFHGPRILGTLRDHLADAEIPAEVRRRLPKVLGTIGGAEAGAALSDALLTGDAELRAEVLTALHGLRRRQADLPLDQQMVETVLAGEILGHYRSYQILETLGDGLHREPTVWRALREGMDREMERIFQLLALLYPRRDLESAFQGLRSGDSLVEDHALEFLDNVLRPPIRNLLFPLIDGSLSPAERARQADRLVGVRVESPEAAAAALVASGDAWLKSCGAFAIGHLRLRSLEGRLDECLEHPDPLLRETARQAKRRLAGEAA